MVDGLLMPGEAHQRLLVGRGGPQKQREIVRTRHQELPHARTLCHARIHPRRSSSSCSGVVVSNGAGATHCPVPLPRAALEGRQVVHPSTLVPCAVGAALEGSFGRRSSHAPRHGHRFPQLWSRAKERNGKVNHQSATSCYCRVRPNTSTAPRRRLPLLTWKAPVQHVVAEVRERARREARKGLGLPLLTWKAPVRST